jgi:hypothetical protein
MKEGSKYQFTHIGFNIFICVCTRTKLKGTHFGGGRAKDINGEKEVFLVSFVSQLTIDVQNWKN